MSASRAIIPVYLAIALCLGGASAAGLESNMLLQLLAIPLLVWGLMASSEAPLTPPSRQLLALLVGLLSVLVVQLIPLPPAIWANLPGRERVIEGRAMLGLALPWMPLSLNPMRTLSSLLWLLPAIAVLVATVRVNRARPAAIAWVIVGITLISVAIGALQSASSEGSPWYFYRITNSGVGTGFFANANHMATLFLVSVPFLAALFLEMKRRRSGRGSSAVAIAFAIALLIIFVGLALNRSLAGIGLAVPVLAASALLLLARKKALSGWWVGLLALLVLASAAAVFTAPFGNNLTSQGAADSDDSRFTSFRIGLRASADFMPAGSGVGTFGEIYPMYEDPAAVTPFFMNHVHGDYIEVALETGVLGLLLILLFLLWWTRRTIAIWRADQPNHFVRAATIASGAMLAHSLVDYPLRTAALSALFALCCALMAEPPLRSRRGAGSASDAVHLSAD